MKNESLKLPITLKNGKSISLEICCASDKSLFLFEGSEAIDCESPYQLVEGGLYDYRIENGYYFKNSNGIVSPNKFNKSIGRISPNIYVGTLSLEIFNENEEDICGVVKLEVQSVKTSYRKDYRKMLSDITEQCIELVFQHSSPVTQIVDVDYYNDSKTLYQRFAFIKSVLDSEEFNDAVHKVISSPVTKWMESEIDTDIRSIRRINNKTMRQIATSSNRIGLPKDHPLETRLGSVPAKIKISYKKETIDTPENRFIKHSLKSFLSVVSELKSKTKGDSKIFLEAAFLEDNLEKLLSYSIFKEVSNPSSIILNSPILQRKEGYREILKAWLMFNLAAQLTWIGGDDVYDIGKRDVAVLYEYWLFFQLLQIIEKVFGIKPNKDLIVDTNDKLGLQLKQGICFPIEGVCNKHPRKLRVLFSYNRTFYSSENNYPKGGSWTRNMRPDYTLSIWPDGIDEPEAERQELIVHLHFDAKYKIEKIVESFGDVENLDDEKVEQSKGTYKRADLLKMHSYKDAIRRTGGAYILYPGIEKTTYNRMGFRELIPGLGAFQIRPSEDDDNGSLEIEKFIEDVVYHFINRTSQREKAAFRTFDIHKNKPIDDDGVRDILPENINTNRNLLPDEIFVLVAFYRDEEQLKWITEKNLYNARAGSTLGSLRLSPKETGAKYLLLHTTGETKSSKLYKLKENGPRIFSKQDLISKSYPSPNPSQDFYLVYDIEKNIEKEFQSMKWDVTLLPGYKPAHGSAIPFTVSLSELMTKSLIR